MKLPYEIIRIIEEYSNLSLLLDFCLLNKSIYKERKWNLDFLQKCYKDDVICHDLIIWYQPLLKKQIFLKQRFQDKFFWKIYLPNIDYQFLKYYGKKQKIKITLYYNIGSLRLIDFRT